MPVTRPQNMPRPETSIEDISQAASLITRTRPEFTPIIEFYARIFTAQEKSRRQINISPVIIPPDLLALKFSNAMPLVDPSQLIVDRDQAKNLLEELIALTYELSPSLSGHARKLDKHLESLNLDPLFADILQDRSRELEIAAQIIDIPVQPLMFFIFLSMTPSLQTCSTQLASYLKNSDDLQKGYCPVCGSHPNTGFIDQEGRRHLVCSLCAHEWHTARMGCVYCDTSDSRMLQYFYSENEMEYRVYLCDNCRNYLKVVDLRHLNRAYIPRLEQIATLHLDMKAGQKGYTNPVPD